MRSLSAPKPAIQECIDGAREMATPGSGIGVTGFSGIPDKRRSGCMGSTIDRRQFFSICGATMATACLAEGIAHATIDGVGRRILMIEELTKALFQQHVGEPFTVSAEGVAPVTLTLAKVIEAPQRKQPAGAPAMECFSVLFEGAKETALVQNTYTFENTRMGSVALFAVPVVSGDEAVRRYEVVINRLIQTGSGSTPGGN
jgi:hypothetical protein